MQYEVREYGFFSRLFGANKRFFKKTLKDELRSTKKVIEEDINKLSRDCKIKPSKVQEYLDKIRMKILKDLMVPFYSSKRFSLKDEEELKNNLIGLKAENILEGLVNSYPLDIYRELWQYENIQIPTYTLTDVHIEDKNCYFVIKNVSRKETRKEKGKEVLKTIDKGVLCFTDKKIIYLTPEKNVIYKYSDILYFRLKRSELFLSKERGKSPTFKIGLDKYDVLRLEFILDKFIMGKE